MRQRIKNYQLQDWMITAKEKFVLLKIIVSTLIFIAILSYCSVNLYERPRGLQGKVVNKNLTFVETQFGSKMSKELLIEGKNAEIIKLRVDSREFDNTEIGDNIKINDNGEIVKLDN